MFFSPLPCPAAKCPQSRCEKSFPLIRFFSRLSCSAPHRRSLPPYGSAGIPADILGFRTADAPAFYLSVSLPEACQPCVQHLSLLLGKQPAQKLSGAFARIPRSPLLCRCFVLGQLLTAVVPHSTMHRMFDHMFIICSIVILASKTPLHQSAGVFSLLSGLEQVLQQRIF